MPTRGSPNPKPRLRWYQYSLRSLLILVTLFAFAGSWFATRMARAKRQQDAVAAIRNVPYGNVCYEDECDIRGYRISSTLQTKPSVPRWWLSALGKDFFDDVTFVRLQNGLPKDRLECLRLFPKLRGMEVAYLADSDFENFRGLADLEFLQCDNSEVTDKGLQCLKRLKRLTALFLIDTKIDRAGWASLGELTQIEILGLSGTNLDDSAVAQLTKLSALDRLFLSNTNITDEGLKHVGKIGHVRELYLDSTKITDAGLKHLSELHQLEILWLENAGVTYEAIIALQKKLPNLKKVTR